jgi:PAS domain-containing protein
MLAGFVLWMYTLLLPALSRAHLLPTDWLRDGPLQLAWLRPESLFGLQGWDPLTHGVFWSLLVNIGMFLVVSARYRPNFDERIRQSFPRPVRTAARWSPVDEGQRSTGDLLALPAASSASATRNAASPPPGRTGVAAAPAAPADARYYRTPAAARSAPRLRVSRDTAARFRHGIGRSRAMLDEAGQELRFNRGILAATLENMSQGVSVVDRGMHLIAWNRRYQEMFEVPDGLLYVGRPVADLIRYNAERGELGPGDVEVQIANAWTPCGLGTPHVCTSVRAGGWSLRCAGDPCPAAITTYRY